MTRRGILGVLLAGATGFVSGCHLFGYRATRLRYRMTVEVETQQGVRSGSSVLESSLVSSPSSGQSSGLNSYLKGEAVAVDLPDGQTLFALLSSPGEHSPSDYQDQLFNNALNAGAESTPPMPRRYESSEWSEMRRVATRLKPALTLPAALYPQLVRFRDVRDPKTVEAVAPDALAAVFGEGVTLKRITLTVTDDAVTTGIEKRLAWLKEYYDKLLNGDNIEGLTPDLSGHLGAGNFSEGFRV